MNEYTGNNVKHIDGIYKGTKPLRSPIQVELDLEMPANVHVKWSTTQSATRTATVSEDKFYTVATAALTGTKPPRQSRLRLQRYKRTDKDENSLTIAQAVKRAQAVENKGKEARAHNKSQKVIAVIQKYINLILAKLMIIFFKIKSGVQSGKSWLAARYQQKNGQKVIRSQVSKLVIIQFIIILILGTGLGATLYSYSRYKSNMNAAFLAQQAESDAKWQELQASWQCISAKWEQMQTNPGVNNQKQGDDKC